MSRSKGPGICAALRPFWLQAETLAAASWFDVLSKFCGQATKGAWWMPWKKQAMKAVASCDKPRGAARRL